MMARASASPCPVPRPTSLVVKKGSRILSNADDAVPFYRLQSRGLGGKQERSGEEGKIPPHGLPEQRNQDVA
jgi:hypothetical protein